MDKPQEVTQQEAMQIIESFQPLGCFYLKDGNWYVGIDNRTGDAWTEDFPSKEKCLRWLMSAE